MKKYFYALCVFGSLIGLLVFGALKIFSEKILGIIYSYRCDTSEILAFLNYRTYGLMFSYVGLGVLCAYMGLSG
ncbi:MAG: hypothetical protein U0T81_00905 [Saprospiraceae bacterium]